MIAAILRSRNSANPSINSHDDERCLDARTIKSRGDVHCPAIERLSRLQLCMEGLDSVVAGISPFGPVDWHRDFFLPLEQYRGLDTSEDHLLAGVFRLQLQQGQSATLVLSTNPDAELDGIKSLADRKRLEDSLLAVWENTNKLASSAPVWIEQLVLNANQFVVKRELPGDPDARSIIAGYHWFGDWGRDTMIALPGLLITT